MSVAKPVHSPDGTAQPAASSGALARPGRGRSLALSQRWTWRLTALAVLLLAGLLIGALVYGFLRTAARITVTVDGMPATVYTHQPTVGDLLAEMQISLRPEDRLLVAADTLLQPGLAIEIQRARPVLVDAMFHLARNRIEQNPAEAEPAEQAVRAFLNACLPLAEGDPARQAAIEVRGAVLEIHRHELLADRARAAGQTEKLREHQLDIAAAMFTFEDLSHRLAREIETLKARGRTTLPFRRGWSGRCGFRRRCSP